LLCEHGHIEVDTTRKDAPLRVHYEDEGEQEIAVSMNNPLIEGLVSEYAEFLDRIAGKGGGVLSAEDACTAVACAEAIIRSADTGERVAIG
jgi:predicted dehydrogenase